MNSTPLPEIWLAVGSQDLYGEETLARVAENAAIVAGALDAETTVPVRVVPTPVLRDTASIHELCMRANRDDSCVGVVAWMHTFSPAKMWLPGLSVLDRPLLHLHTQVHRELPWGEVDMDFMNLHQSAHGDREFAHGASRVGIRRKTVVGHWRDPGVVSRLADWARATLGWAESRSLRVARFGDSMRGVAVTDGDRVEAQLRFGFSVSGFGIETLEVAQDAVADADVEALVAEYMDCYEVVAELRPTGARHESLREAARIELALRSFLVEGGFAAFTDTFEELGRLPQLPGIAVQRLMADGYGFAAEGDWKTAALVRVTKAMSAGASGGTSFMEDYTYDFGLGDEGAVLGAHMLELCPSITSSKPRCEIHPLSIGGKGDPVRLTFDGDSGPAVVAALLDTGSRFRMVLNVVDAVAPAPLPRLPVARALWRPRPNLATAAESWLSAGAPHHSVFTQAVTTECFSDFAEIAGCELVVIDEMTTASRVRAELRWNEAAYRLGIA